MKKRILLFGMLLSAGALAATEEMVVAEGSGGAVKGIFYKEDNFHEMATLPGFSMGAPVGMVPGWGVVFGGISGRSNSDETDGALALGMGFGNPDVIGGSVSLGFGSIDPRDGGALNRGSLNISAGHHFKSWGLGTAIGVTGIDLWHANGDDRDDNLDPSFYGAVTKLLPNEVAPVVISAGLGNNGYADINVKNPKDKIGGFVAAAVYIIPQVSLIADYTSNIVTLGAGIVPFPKYPISLTLGINDITEQYDNKPSFIGSLSAAYVF